MSEQREFPIPLATDADIAEFIARHGKAYDPATDAYHCEPFVADIREGKNDPIYNAHSYHTKVPPRAIIPYILHYTEPGDVILDPFCGSGMTGVAAMMCEDPPEDILKAVPGAKKGARRAILNDLSPAACHIAYNYCTPVDAEALKAEFERIKAAVKEEFDWLYGTEHYEPAAGLYDPAKPEVACRLTNPPPDVPVNVLMGESEPTWELLDRSEVEQRMGAEALAKQPLPTDIRHFICIPAVIQYTIWSDIYKCQGMITIEEETVHSRKRGKEHLSQLVVRKRRAPRGCGAHIELWHSGVDLATGEIADEFRCQSCGLSWKKRQLHVAGNVPARSVYEYRGLELKENGSVSPTIFRSGRPVTSSERESLVRAEAARSRYWFPSESIDCGREMMRHGNLKRGVSMVSDFFAPRNQFALSLFWFEVAACRDPRVRSALRFIFTSICNTSSRLRFYRPTGPGDVRKATLYIASLTSEFNVKEAWNNKFSEILAAYKCIPPSLEATNAIRLGCATVFPGIANESIDYVFADPPFGSNIFYADASLLWESWLGVLTEEAREIVVSDRRKNGPFKRLEDYSRLMRCCFGEMFRVLKPGRWATIEFNNSNGQVFESIKKAARDAGFVIENMVFLDKVQKTFKQIKGEKGEEDVAGHDVIFNLRKPAPVLGPTTSHPQISDQEKHQALRYIRQELNSAQGGVAELLEHTAAETVQEHLRTLPDRIQKDPKTYSDEHRTTPFLNTMLMNALIPKGVDVSRLNLPFIDRICARYFHKVDNRWYVPDEPVGNHRSGQYKGELFRPPEHEVVIQDERTAIAWLRRRLTSTPLRIGDLRPHWMRATVKLTSDISTNLEEYLRRHFWLDRQTRQWREPTEEERAQMHNLESQRARHDAERFLTDDRPHPSDMEILAWIGSLYESAAALEQEAIGLSDTGETSALPEEAAQLYRMILQLFPLVLKEKVEPAAFIKAQRQSRIARSKLGEQAQREEAGKPRETQPSLFD